MTQQDEIAIRGRLLAIEFLLKFGVAERFRKESDPVAILKAYKELAIAALKVEAERAPNADAAVYKAAADATGSFYSEVNELLPSTKAT